MSLIVLFSIVNIAVVFANGPTHGKKVVCYMHSWSHYRTGAGHFSIEDIDPLLCTDIVYAFAVLDEDTNTIKSADFWQDLEINHGLAAYSRLVALKASFPHLRVSVAVGGWVDGARKYSRMAAAPAARRAFVNSVLDFLKLHNFDGLDMHWKFPTLREGKPYDKANYVLLLKELKEAFAPHNYLLTAAFSPIKSTMDAAYDLAELNRHLDYMHLLSFDYHGAWDGLVGSNAPLRGNGQNDLHSLEFSVNYMIDNGVSPQKIILGLPSFGRTFELVDPTVKNVQFSRTRSKLVSFQGPYTAENGLMGYNEICMETSNKSTHWSHHWDARSATAYIRDKERVVCYDSGRSVAVKVKMAVDRGLGGLMLFTLDTDDFRGQCDDEVGSYVDFQKRFTELTSNPELRRTLPSLYLPALDKASSSDYYVTSNGQLILRLPQRTHSNYNLLRTADAAALLAIQEKKILDALQHSVNYGTGPSHGKKVVCYMHSWSHYRTGAGHFSIEDIDPSLCTDIVYAFAVLDEDTNTIKSADIWQDLSENQGKAAYSRLVALKASSPHLRVSVAVGGWADGARKYSRMAAAPATRRAFVNSVLDFLKLHNFDGLDMHWKFPTLRDGKPYDKANYVLLLKELKEAFADKYLLTASVAPDKSTMDAAFDLAELNRHLDYMHLLSFDYHGAWQGSVNANAPLRGIDQSDSNNLESAVNHMIENGVSPGKIILGVPAFGHTFELKDPTVKSVEFGQTRSKPVGFQGPYTAENGLMGYNEICMETSNKSSHWSHYFDDRSATAYIRDKERVVCYDSGRSIAAKVKFAVDRGLGGFMFWTLDTDDFRGQCYAEVDSYMDFMNRLNEITKNSALPRVIRSLNIPTYNTALSTEYYVTRNGQLTLRLPQRQHGNYNLLRVLNAVSTLATQEKRILDALPYGDNDGVSGFRSDYILRPNVGWFKEHSEPADWHTARLQCHYEGAVLASPLNKEIATVLNAIIFSAQVVSSNTSLFFSGIHKTFGKGMYTSIEGVPLEKMFISKWRGLQPASRAECLALSGAGAQQLACRERLPYVCYRALCAADRLSPCGTIDRAYKLDAASGQCHKLHSAGGRWARALAACGAEGGRLAVAASVGQARALAALAGPRAALLGLRRWGTGWWTVAGTPLSGAGFSQWCPECARSELECGALSGGQLAAVSCDAVQPFLCERETDVLTNATGEACASTSGLPFLTC